MDKGIDLTGYIKSTEITDLDGKKVDTTPFEGLREWSAEVTLSEIIIQEEIPDGGYFIINDEDDFIKMIEILAMKLDSKIYQQVVRRGIQSLFEGRLI